MTTAPWATLAGRLVVRPGQARPLSGGRPVLDAGVLRRLMQGQPADAWPARMAALFGACGAAHRLTATRALRAARGLPQPADAAARALARREDTLLHLWTAREHLQRLALDLPARLPVAGVAADGAWLRGLPLARLPADAATADDTALRALADAWAPWFDAVVLGGGGADGWAEAWSAEADAPADAPSPLQAWGARRDTPAMRWLHGAAAAGRALALPCRPLGADALSPQGLPSLAGALAADTGFAARPLWRGAAAETGAWTRMGYAYPAVPPHNAWMRWQYRMAELIALARPGDRPVLRSGALQLDDGHGVAWTEMSRGVLVHAVRLARQGTVDVVDTCQVLAPTEWNFHPDGGLARALAAPGLPRAAVAAAIAALDPCVPVDLHATPEAAHA